MVIVFKRGTSLSQEDVARTLAANAGISFVRLQEITIDPIVIESIKRK